MIYEGSRKEAGYARRGARGGGGFQTAQERRVVGIDHFATAAVQLYCVMSTNRALPPARLTGIVKTVKSRYAINRAALPRGINDSEELNEMKIFAHRRSLPPGPRIFTNATFLMATRTVC